MESKVETTVAVSNTDQALLHACPNEHCIRVRNNFVSLTDILGLTNLKVASLLRKVENLEEDVRREALTAEALRVVLSRNFRRLDLFGVEINFHNKETQHPEADEIERSSVSTQYPDAEVIETISVYTQCGDADCIETISVSTQCQDADEIETSSGSGQCLDSETSYSPSTWAALSESSTGYSDDVGFTSVGAEVELSDGDGNGYGIEKEAESGNISDLRDVPEPKEVDDIVDAESSCDQEAVASVEATNGSSIDSVDGMKLACPADAEGEITDIVHVVPVTGTSLIEVSLKVEPSQSSTSVVGQADDQFVDVKSVMTPCVVSPEGKKSESGAEEEDDSKEWDLEGRNIPEYLKVIPLMWKEADVVIDVETNSDEDTPLPSIDTGVNRRLYEISVEELVQRYGKPRLVIPEIHPSVLAKLDPKSKCIGRKPETRASKRRATNSFAINEYYKRVKTETLPITPWPAGPFKDVNATRRWKSRSGESDEWDGFGLVKVLSYVKVENGVKQVYSGSLRLIYARSEIAVSQNIRLYECFVFTRTPSASHTDVYNFERKGEEFEYYSDEDLVFKVDMRGGDPGAKVVTFHVSDFHDYANKIENVSTTI